MAETGTDITKAATLLRSGETVAIPTETVYGLAGNALNEKAVMQIFSVKNRPSFDPLIIHIATTKQIEQWVTTIPTPLDKLLNAFSPGPLTVLLPKKKIISDIVTSGMERVAIRIPNHPLTLSLLAQLDFPLAAPSANPFGYISPTTAMHVEAQLGNSIPYILDGGACSVGIESTIVGMENNRVIIYRLGGLAIETIQDIVGDIEIRTSSSAPHAPGMLLQHYAPRKEIHVGNINELIQKFESKKCALLTFCDKIEGYEQRIMSERSDLNEAASNLFGHLRALDSGNADIILAEFAPAKGLGLAINDRLKRASVKK